jgi:hypothetical protein
MRGIVGSVNSVFVGASNQIGALEGGSTATKLMAVVNEVVFGGVMTLLTVTTTAFVLPNFRILDLEKVG